MNEQSLSSISFVISAAYTFTFANAIFFMIAIDPNSGFSPQNIGYDYQKIVCGIICMIMTLRFFFGNNQYIYDVMNSEKNAWVKFYQFVFIAIQSIILLMTSYFIPDVESFIWATASLFGVETAWYLLTFLVDRDGVWPDDKNARRQFLIAQIFNFSFFAGVLIVSYFTADRSYYWLNLIFFLFLINTAFDLRKNMSYYMGSNS